jgi:hypothetical protein
MMQMMTPHEIAVSYVVIVIRRNPLPKPHLPLQIQGHTTVGYIVGTAVMHKYCHVTQQDVDDA